MKLRRTSHTQQTNTHIAGDEESETERIESISRYVHADSLLERRDGNEMSTCFTFSYKHTRTRRAANTDYINGCVIHTYTSEHIDFS